jgi:allophanate hydrolase
LDCVTVFAEKLEDCVCVDKILSENLKSNNASTAKVFIPENELEFFSDYKDEYKSNWEKAVNKIRKFIKTEKIDYTPFFEVALMLYGSPFTAERIADLGEFVNSHPDDIFPVTKKILESGNNPEYTASALFKAQHKLSEYREKVHKLLKGNILMLPTAGGIFTRKQVAENPIETNSKMGLYKNHCNLLDLCAVSVENVTFFAVSGEENLIVEIAEKFLKKEIQIAVCGLHKKDFPLEFELTQLGATFSEHTKTSPEYRLYKLENGKPGLVKVTNGKPIEIDIFNLPCEKFGEFLLKVNSPLCIGNVSLIDGRTVKGFLCENYATETGTEINKFEV